MKLKYKLFLLTVLFMTCIGAVSASSLDNSIYLDTASLADDDMGEIDANNVGYESNMEDETAAGCDDYGSNSDDVLAVSSDDYGSNSDDVLAVSSDENPLCDDGDLSGTSVSTENGGIRNISLSDGYNGYCIDMTLHGSQPGQSFTVTDTSVIMSHIYDTPVGEYLKILFYNYYDEVSSNKEDTSEIIWTFTDRYYKDSTNELVKKVISDYDGGLRVPDHGAVKKLNDTHEMIFDFETLISSEESIQNYFGYKVSIREIEDSSETNDSSDDNGTDDGSDNSTDEDSSDNGTDEDTSDNSTDDEDTSDNSSDEEADVDSSDDEDYTSGLDEKSASGNQKSTAVSKSATGNPLVMLLLALALVFVPFKRE